MGLANAERTLGYIRTLVEFISQPEYVDVVCALYPCGTHTRLIFFPSDSDLRSSKRSYCQDNWKGQLDVIVGPFHYSAMIASLTRCLIARFQLPSRAQHGAIYHRIRGWQWPIPGNS